MEEKDLGKRESGGKQDRERRSKHLGKGGTEVKKKAIQTDRLLCHLIDSHKVIAG